MFFVVQVVLALTLQATLNNHVTVTFSRFIKSTYFYMVRQKNLK